MDFQDAMDCAEEFFKFLCKWLLEKNSEDMKFVVKRMDKNSTERLQSVISNSVQRISYTEALDALKKVSFIKIIFGYTILKITAISSNFCLTHVLNFSCQVADKKVERKLEWGAALTTEHLRYSTMCIKRPMLKCYFPK